MCNEEGSERAKLGARSLRLWARGSRGVDPPYGEKSTFGAQPKQGATMLTLNRATSAAKLPKFPILRLHRGLEYRRSPKRRTCSTNRCVVVCPLVRTHLIQASALIDANRLTVVKGMKGDPSIAYPMSRSCAQTTMRLTVPDPHAGFVSDIVERGRSAIIAISKATLAIAMEA
jgi:hypothetical protein